MNTKPQRWSHPGGKLRELGAESLSDAELLACLISTGIPGKPAEEIAKEILQRFGGFEGMATIATMRPKRGATAPATDEIPQHRPHPPTNKSRPKRGTQADRQYSKANTELQ